MSDQAVFLQLPEHLYNRIRQVAEASNQSLETLLVDSLSLMFGKLPDHEQLAAFSDQHLWAIVSRQPPLQEREIGRSAEDQTRSIEEYDRYVLLRSQALLLLKQRGHDVEQRLHSREFPA